MIKVLSGNEKVYIFQISAVRTGVCAYKDATPLNASVYIDILINVILTFIIKCRSKLPLSF